MIRSNPTNGRNYLMLLLGARENCNRSEQAEKRHSVSHFGIDKSSYTACTPGARSLKSSCVQNSPFMVTSISCWLLVVGFNPTNGRNEKASRQCTVATGHKEGFSTTVFVSIGVGLRGVAYLCYVVYSYL